MGSFILRTIRPQAIQAWIAANAPGSLKPSARDSWRAYLQANSGTGQTIADLETSFLAGQGKSGGTIHDRWSSYLTGTGKAKERARARYH